MTKRTKQQNKEIDSLYKNLTKEKFAAVMQNLHILNCALGHLAYVCEKEKDKGVLQIPIVEHPDAVFIFQLMENKLTKERILCVEVEDAKKNSSH